MEHLAQRAVLGTLKLRSGNFQSSGIRFSRACFCNTNYDRAQGVVKDASDEGEAIKLKGVYNDDVKLESMSGVAGFVADTAVGVKKAVDTAWDSTRNAAREIQDTVIASADDNVVDTSEYRRSIELSPPNNNNSDSSIDKSNNNRDI